MTARHEGAAPARTGADLAAVVETEARLDRALRLAHDAAAALRADAARRARDEATALETELAAAHARIAAEVAAATAAHVAEVTAAGQREAARFDAIIDARLETLGRWVAQQVVALALEDAP